MHQVGSMFGQMAQQVATHTACTRCSLYIRMSLHISRSYCATTLHRRKSSEASEGRTFGQRQRRRRSMLKSTQWGTGMDDCLDEMQYDSTSVDDWGVNRDMQKAYRAPLEKEFDACKASAAGMLAFRPHTRSELTTKLTDKGYDKACIERSINRLQELGLQSDSEFAAVFARSKWRQSRWAPSRIRIELVRRGVDSHDIDVAMREAFGPDTQKLHIHHDSAVDDGNAEAAGRFKLKRELVDSAQRQVHLTRGSPLETRRRRLVAWLQRRGHSWDTISAILKELAF